MTPQPAPRTRSDRVVLVDDHGRPTGVADKLEAHRAPGMAHLAFSLVLFRPDEAMLLQRRAGGKYHFSGLWSNSCCSHPRPGETVVAAARRRAQEELGAAVTDLRRVGSFWYRAADPRSGLVEHELDVVVTGRTSEVIVPDPSEVSETEWATMAQARDRCERLPGSVTPWLRSVLGSIATAER